jgi:mannose-6-phosphate isomerase-like protein (cupin superfamily)
MLLGRASEVFTPTEGHRFNDAPITDNTPYQDWGYTVAYETDAEGNSVPDWGNTAIFRIQGMTEPVLVTKPTHFATFTVDVLSGQGQLIRSFPTGAVEALDLKEGDEIIIQPGQAYSYVNTGESDLVLKDIAMPAFQPGDDAEILLFEDSFDVNNNLRKLPSSSYCHVRDHLGQISTISLRSEFFDLIGQALARQKTEL